MLRMFQLTCPTSNTSSIWDLIVAAGYCDVLGNVLVTGVKNQEIIVDRCINLDISTDTGNSGTVTIYDRAGRVFNAFAKNTNFNKTSNRNSICLKDYFPVGSGSSQLIDVAMESV